MKIAVYTSNQPRHISLIEKLALIADTVFVTQECNTVFPGEVQDFYKKSDIMQRYFGEVIEAEKHLFGEPRFLPENATSLSLKMGDLGKLPLSVFVPALEADFHIVFGASYIRGPLVDALVERRAVNIHMGVSPYYRGSSCNFWALYGGNPHLVGATVHMLSKGLDSGEMLFHALPPRQACPPFELGMRAVKAAHEGLTKALSKNAIFDQLSVVQDKADEISYTRNGDFTDEVAAEFLEHLPQLISESDLKREPPRPFIRPFISGAA